MECVYCVVYIVKCVQLDDMIFFTWLYLLQSIIASEYTCFRVYLLQSILTESVRLNFGESPCKEGNVRFTTVPLKSLLNNLSSCKSVLFSLCFPKEEMRKLMLYRK